jgi:hypothetical protein
MGRPKAACARGLELWLDASSENAAASRGWRCQFGLGTSRRSDGMSGMMARGTSAMFPN